MMAKECDLKNTGLRGVKVADTRIAGWCAHIIEEKFGLAQKKPLLYRPSAEYIGNYCGLMGCEFKKGSKEE